MQAQWRKVQNNMSAPRVAQIPIKKLFIIYRISFDGTTIQSLNMKIFPERCTVEDGSMLLGIKSHTDVLGKKKRGKKKREGEKKSLDRFTPWQLSAGKKSQES